jgi:hypothetical protein
MATQLENNINKLKESIYGINFDIASSFLPDNEIAKNIIRAKTPSLSKEDAEMMIDGKISGLTSSVANEKELLSKFGRDNHIYPLPKTSQYYDQVKKMKDDTRQAAMLMVKSQKDLIQDLIKISVQISTAIAGAAVLVSPPSFNVPAAISLVMLIVDAISKIVDKLMDVIQYLDPLKNLTYLLPKNKFDVITTPLNLALTILISIFGAVKSLKSIASGLVGKLKKKVKPSNLSSQISSLKKQLESAKADLNWLKGFGKHRRPNGTAKEIKDKQDEIDELTERLANMEKGYKIPEITDDGFDENDSVEFLNSIDPMITQVRTANIELISYIYDVYLPDGTLVPNVSEDYLEEIKSKYTVIFNENSV